MSPGQTLALGAFIFALAVFVGFLLISKVPTMLHTPLMSGTNFIHGIVLVGALTVAASANDTLGYIIGMTFRVGHAKGLASGGMDKTYVVAAVPF